MSLILLYYSSITAVGFQKCGAFLGSRSDGYYYIIMHESTSTKNTIRFCKHRNVLLGVYLFNLLAKKMGYPKSKRPFPWTFCSLVHIHITLHPKNKWCILIKLHICITCIKMNRYLERPQTFFTIVLNVSRFSTGFFHRMWTTQVLIAWPHYIISMLHLLGGINPVEKKRETFITICNLPFDVLWHIKLNGFS